MPATRRTAQSRSSWLRLSSSCHGTRPSWDLCHFSQRSPALSRRVLAIWFSGIESPAVVDGTVYVGSSDAAKLFALDAGTGRSKWELDVLGWAWSQPAVSGSRVFAGTAGIGQYLVKQQVSSAVWTGGSMPSANRPVAAADRAARSWHPACSTVHRQDRTRRRTARTK